MEARIAFELVGLVLGIAISAFFAASETAFLSISNVKLQSLLEKDKKGAQSLSRLRSRRRRVVIALLIGGNIANVTSSALATSICVILFGDTGLAIAVGVMSFLLLTLGDIAPKSAATSYSENIALFNAPIIEVFFWIIYPAVLLFEGINRLIPGVYSRATGIERFSEDEVRSAIKLGAKSQSITDKEAEMIENVLAFDDRLVSNAMTPRTEVRCLNGEKTVSEMHEYAFKVAQHSRYPVLVGNSVVGVISVRRLGKFFYESPGAQVKDVALPAVHIKSDSKANEAFTKLQTQGRNIAIVDGPDNEFIGIITLEDLLEELVGEII